MKFITKILIVGLVFAFSACDNTELALQENPNAITADKASVNDLYSNIQLNFRNFLNNINNSNDGPGGMSRMTNSFNSFSYDATIAPTTLSALWFNAYSSMYPDIDALDAIASERGLDIHSGSAKIMKAYTLMALVDVFGDVPFSEIGQGTDIIAPKVDPGKSIYDAAIALLDEAIAQMDGTTAAAPTTDVIYGGDATKWITAAKTLKLRAAVTTYLTDANAASTINALVSEGDLISDASQDFQWNYSNQRTNPNSRHPWYNNHYEIGDGDYLSNYYMWLLRADKTDVDGNAVIDPRIRFYFYRKVEKADEQDQTTYSCHFSTLPIKENAGNAIAHYDAVDPDLPYCIVLPGDGYSGRDHMNGEGIPPDGPTRTSYGLYPAGGQFDLSEFQDTRQAGTTGGLGAGVWPIMTASFVDFMRAEAALRVGTNDDPKALLESGMRKSISKVFGFTTLVSGTMSRIIDARPCSGTSVQDCFVPTDEDIDAYVQFVLDEYDATDDKLNIVMREYYIALWGNGLEAYNMFR
ncbi:MAG: SusD/RagB family nutrient-binding outer membrane lipoprotein, partial [Bacteroidota bacterium]